jgi:hypothetical protein
MVAKAGHNCDEIHIIFDNYREEWGEGKKRKVERVALSATLVRRCVSCNSVIMAHMLVSASKVKT